MSSENKSVIVQGRIVWINGDLFTGALETVYGTNQPKIDPKTGKQNTVYRFGLSVQKSELTEGRGGFALWVAMHQEARTLYPSGQIPPTFTMKYKDGDGTDDKGKPFGLREGYAGCLVFTLSTNIQPRFFKWENGQNIVVPDGIKCGDYVNVQVKVDSQNSAKPGLYLNPMCIQLVAPGKEIINAPTGDQVFGLAAPPVPVGYVPPEQPSMPTAAPAAIAAPPAMPPPAAAAPQPHYGVLPPTHQPPPGGMPIAPAAPGFPPVPGVPR